jgi:hypothetical protein
VVYAATSKGYRHAIAVATSPSYAEEIMKAKLPTCLRGDIETLTLPRHEIDDDGRKTVTAWVPNQVRESLYKVGISNGYYFSELYYSFS